MTLTSLWYPKHYPLAGLVGRVKRWRAVYNKVAAERAKPACKLIIAFFAAVPTPAIQLARLLATTASHHNTAGAETVACHLTHLLHR